MLVFRTVIVPRSAKRGAFLSSYLTSCVKSLWILPIRNISRFEVDLMVSVLTGHKKGDLMAESITSHDQATSSPRVLDPLATCVGDIMTTELVTFFPHHTFAEAVQLMSNCSFRHFLVI